MATARKEEQELLGAAFSGPIHIVSRSLAIIASFLKKVLWLLLLLWVPQKTKDVK